jgi:hypothetical protein
MRRSFFLRPLSAFGGEQTRQFADVRFRGRYWG